MLRAIVVGARCRRQGIGEFIARSLRDAGCEIAGIVGTSDATVAAAQRTLGERFGIEARGYTSLATGLAIEEPALVAVCSPYIAHREQLELVARAGAHCLCEKPLWWGADASNAGAVTESLANTFATQGLLLDLVTQWPFTLGAFDALHGNARRRPLKTFAMILSPESRGSAMIPDAVPHLWSLLYALAGDGRVEDPAAHYADASGEDLSLRFAYRHDAGETLVSCRLLSTPARAKPAAYAINGCWAHRQVTLPDYAMRFVCEERSVAFDDPLELLVRDFVHRMRRGDATNVPRLVASMAILDTLAACAARAGSAIEG